MAGIFDTGIFDTGIFDSPAAPGGGGGPVGIQGDYPSESAQNGFTVKLNGDDYPLPLLNNSQLGALSLAEMAFDLQIGQGSITIPTPEDIDWNPGDRLSFYTAEGTFITSMFIVNRGVRRSGRTEIETTFPLMDVNRQAIGRIVLNWQRDQEGATDRLLAWVADFFGDISIDTSNVETDTTTMEAKTYSGDGLTDLAADLIAATAKTLFIRAVEDAEYELHFHDLPVVPPSPDCDLSISDDRTEVGGDVYWPVNPSREYDASDLTMTVTATNGFDVDTEGFVVPTDGGIWYGRLLQMNGTPLQVNQIANSTLNNSIAQKPTYNVGMGPLSGEQVARIPVGSIVSVKSDVLKLDGSYGITLRRRELRLVGDAAGNLRTGWWRVDGEYAYPHRVPTATIGYGGEGGGYGGLVDFFAFYDHSETIYTDLQAVPVGGVTTVIGRMHDAVGGVIPVAGKTMDFVLEELEDDDYTASDDWSIAGETVLSSHEVTATTNVAGEARVDLIHDSDVSWAKVRVVATVDGF